MGPDSINHKPFYIFLNESWYKKNDILNLPSGFQVKVVKVYKYNWYRKLLNFFGFKFKWLNCVKVKTL